MWPGAISQSSISKWLGSTWPARKMDDDDAATPLLVPLLAVAFPNPPEPILFCPELKESRAIFRLDSVPSAFSSEKCSLPERRVVAPKFSSTASGSESWRFFWVPATSSSPTTGITSFSRLGCLMLQVARESPNRQLAQQSSARSDNTPGRVWQPLKGKGPKPLMQFVHTTSPLSGETPLRVLPTIWTMMPSN